MTASMRAASSDHAKEAVIELVAGSEHDHRRIAARVFAQALAQGIAINARQHDVQHDQVIVFSGSQVQPGQAILGAIHGVSLQSEVVGQVGKNVAVVFHYKDFHEASPSRDSRRAMRLAQRKASAGLVAGANR
jgi:hypothetical protein